ncbi:MAG: hypothetical protein HQK66_10650 [Desulfamplus sp.]|nr:hypothetical protein [Desulfamplus sp.]
MTYKSIKIVSSYSEEYNFKDVKNFIANTENGIIEVQLADSSFVMLFDRLKYFEVEFSSPQKADTRFSHGSVCLITHPELITIEEVINFEWKTDQGLLMLFGKKATLGIYLQHLISFRLENPTVKA